MIPGEAIISKVIELGYTANQDEMTYSEKEEYLHQNLLDESYSFHLPPEEDPKSASLQFENIGVAEGFSKVIVTLSFDGPELEVPVRRFEEDIQFLYYEIIEVSFLPDVVGILDDFPHVEEIGPGDISITYGFRNATLSRLRWSMKSMARILAFYHGSLHQTAQELYDENGDKYKKDEYEVPDEIEPYGKYDLSQNPAEHALWERYRWSGYVKRYFEFCTDEPFSEDGSSSRRSVYKNRIQSSP